MTASQYQHSIGIGRAAQENIQFSTSVLARHSLPSTPHFHGHVLCEYLSIHVLGSQLAPVWVKKMLVYSHWTGTSGLEWWTGMVELLICSLGFKGAQNLIPLYMALEGPQAASADSR